MNEFPSGIAGKFLPLLVIMAGIFLGLPVAIAQPAYYESEPNNTPLDANAISGEVIVYGTMVSGDQDGFIWTVSDEDARKRWRFELHGIPGALTIADLMRVEYTENGEGVAATEHLMKMGTRDGLTPSIHRGQLFEPGEYLIGIAYAGGEKKSEDGAFRPPAKDLSFSKEDQSDNAEQPNPAQGSVSEERGAYRFIIAESGRLGASKNPGASEERENARSVRLGRSFATFEALETAWYSFTFDESATSQRWEIEARAPIGRPLRAALVDADGNKLVSAGADSHGRILFSDLAPEQTTWYLELTTQEPGFIHWVGIDAVGQRIEGEEAEPNDRESLANRVDFAQPVTGRIGGGDRSDYFLFTADETVSDRLHTLRFESTPPVKLRLCLYDADWNRAQCRDGTSPMELPDLQLTEGPWGISVSRAKEAEYSLALIREGPVEPGTEVEPNDTVEYASAVPAKSRIKGRLTGNDTDFFRFLVAEEPQLWRFQVIGEGVSEIAYYDGSGRQKMKMKAGRGQRRVRLDNVYLLPGSHYLRVSGKDGGRYTLLARALGSPDPNGEIEPNDSSNMQRLAIGQTRTGLLAEANDDDYYRFFLGNWDHIRLTVQPPPDGAVDANLYWYGDALGRGAPSGPGEPLVLEGLFPPGDYHVSLHAGQVSDAEYTVSLERLPRFSCPSDCEPNGMGKIWAAAPLPPDLVLEDAHTDWRDWDYYQLPEFDTPTELLLHTPDSVRVFLGTHYGVREIIEYDSEAELYRTTVPAGAPYRLMIDSRRNPYRIQLEFPNGPLSPVTEPLPVEMELTLDSEAVSAFRLHGQQVTGNLELVNSDDEALEITLDAVTSDYRWQVSLEQSGVTVPSGASIAVKVEVSVPSDAWKGRPVRISAQARGTSGRRAEAWAEIRVERDTAPAQPFLHWAIPETLRGGFNAAWLPFGGEWTEDTSEDMRGKEHLRDGLAFPKTDHSSYATCCADRDGWSEDEKPRWTIDLPGDELLPVAGIAINHFGTRGPYQNIRRATLLLSQDGNNFDEVLTIKTLPVETEQHFALEKPVSARFARLRIDRTFEERSFQRVSSAEWKVILQPGFDLSGGQGFDIARPEMGGHLVWAWPPEGYAPVSILTDESHASRAGMRREPIKDYVIGFNQNRAAQITRIEWRYPEDTAEEYKNFKYVEVAASLQSPVGPWLPLGRLELADRRTVGMLELTEPAWARFVRFTAHRNDESAPASEPGIIRIRERPTDSEYLSVLSEWGSVGPRAFYELQAGLEPEAELQPKGNETRETAAVLDVGTLASGQVSLGRLEHWYQLTVPAEDNTLTIGMKGDPTVRTVLEMETADGVAIPLRRIDRKSTPGEHVFEAFVEPGSDAWLHIAEPPRNIIFSWDTSGSVGPYIPQINNAVVAFSGQVVPGKEAVNLMPFPRNPLLDEWYGDPYILQTILNDYRRPSASSSAEYTLKKAAKALAPLPGTKAIVVITDAKTPHDGEMWDPMQEVQPRIFGVGVGGTEIGDQNRLRDWTAINGGHYTQLRYQGEMEVAFDRATTLMHRPAGYTLLVESEFREAPGPGLLSVETGDDGAGTGRAAVELILDASGSMLQRMEGKRRIVVAKEVLTEAVREYIPAGTPVALRVFGHKEPDACRTDLEIPLTPLDPAAAAEKIASINAMNLARTPIADSLAAVERDLDGAESGVVVLVTDGEETCDGDAEAVIESLQDKGFNISLNIVGFAIDDAELSNTFESWAELGGGRYLPANDQGGLNQAIEEALRIPFTVFDQGGNEVIAGQVGGEPLALEQGIYRVVIHSAPPKTFEDVEVQGEDEIILELD